MGRTQYRIYKIIHIYSNHIYIYTHTLQWRKMMINHQLWDVFPKISDPSHHVGTTEPAARATGLGCNGMRHICFLQSLFPAIPQGSPLHGGPLAPRIPRKLGKLCWKHGFGYTAGYKLPIGRSSNHPPDHFASGLVLAVFLRGYMVNSSYSGDGITYFFGRHGGFCGLVLHICPSWGQVWLRCW